MSNVTRYQPDGDKIMRLHAKSAVIENGFVWLPAEAPWLADYVSELTAFPRWPPRRPDRLDLPGAGPGQASPAGTGMLDFWTGR